MNSPKVCDKVFKLEILQLCAPHKKAWECSAKIFFAKKRLLGVPRAPPKRGVFWEICKIRPKSCSACQGRPKLGKIHHMQAKTIGYLFGYTGFFVGWGQVCQKRRSKEVKNDVFRREFGKSPWKRDKKGNARYTVKNALGNFLDPPKTIYRTSAIRGEHQICNRTVANIFFCNVKITMKNALRDGLEASGRKMPSNVS